MVGLMLSATTSITTGSPWARTIRTACGRRFTDAQYIDVRHAVDGGDTSRVSGNQSPAWARVVRYARPHGRHDRRFRGRAGPGRRRRGRRRVAALVRARLVAGGGLRRPLGHRLAPVDRARRLLDPAARGDLHGGGAGGGGGAGADPHRHLRPPGRAPGRARARLPGPARRLHLGALVMLAGAANRSDGARRRTLEALVVVVGGNLVVALMTLFMEKTVRPFMHGGAFYLIVG